ncbi:MAG: HIT domain-containing protein [Dehalococcoidales bacterium]
MLGLATGKEHRVEHIWAPWRMAYIMSDKPDGCILCSKPGENDDAANLILHRSADNFVMLNAYPYNPGHLLVAPYRHVASFEELAPGELHDHIDTVSRCIRALREAFDPAGFNVGANIGKVAGAGIADHVHSHILPRWQGDVNFMPALADTRVIPEALADTYRRLAGKF